MLAAAEEDVELEELRQSLAILLHVDERTYAALREAGNVAGSFLPLQEIRSVFEGVDPQHATLRIAIPPFLRSRRLREVLDGCLEDLLGTRVSFSVRILAELVDTLQVADEVAEEDPTGAVVCFTDEAAVGELPLPLLGLRRHLDERLEAPVTTAFPLSHYDVFCRWEGPTDPVVWGPEAVVGRAYEDLVKGAVSATARGLSASEAFLAFLMD